MGIAIAGKKVALGAIIAGIGGILAIIGVFLDWISASGGGMTESENATELTAGKLIIALGIVAIVAAVAWALELKVPMLPLATVVIGAAIVVACGVAYFSDVLDKGKGLKDTLDLFSKYSDLGVKGSLGIGFLLDIAAGVVVVVGGALGLVKK